MRDEFSLLADNAAEMGLDWTVRPDVRRESVEVGSGRAVSALLWGSGPPGLILLHGGAQNAHTWDSVALALDRPLVAVDLPGHGHSDWREDHDYSPATMAADLAVVLARLTSSAATVVGMSLGGLTALCLAAAHPELVARLALVDITPGTDAAKAEPILAFLSGPERFADFEAMVTRTVAFNPARSVESLRRGVTHNARQFPDGSWGWRWDPSARGRARGSVDPPVGFIPFWDSVAGLTVPLLLVRGARSTVVSDQDESALLRLRPDATIAVVPDAGHSVQGDQPVALARLLSDFATPDRWLLERPDPGVPRIPVSVFAPPAGGGGPVR